MFDDWMERFEYENARKAPEKIVPMVILSFSFCRFQDRAIPSPFYDGDPCLDLSSPVFRLLAFVSCACRILVCSFNDHRGNLPMMGFALCTHLVFVLRALFLLGGPDPLYAG